VARIAQTGGLSFRRFLAFSGNGAQVTREVADGVMEAARGPRSATRQLQMRTTGNRLEPFAGNNVWVAVERGRGLRLLVCCSGGDGIPCSTLVPLLHPPPVDASGVEGKMEGARPRSSFRLIRFAVGRPAAWVSRLSHRAIPTESRTDQGSHAITEGHGVRHNRPSVPPYHPPTSIYDA
jgi:hypothetical protein